MAHLLNSTRFKSPNPAVSSFDVTIPATAAGSKLVCVAGGGAIITAHLGSGGTSFTKRTTSLNNREVATQDIVDSGGGTTTIQITLNGAENVDGMIFEFASGSLGAFIAGNIESGGGGNTSVNGEGRAIIGTVNTSGAAVLFTMFTAGDNSSVANKQFWGLEPLGKQFANEYIATDSSKSKYWSMIGLSDQSSAGAFNGQSSRTTLSGEHQSVMCAYTDNEPGTPSYPAYANAVAAENSLPGSDFNVYYGGTTSTHISGYTDSISYLPGDTVNFKVYSEDTQFRVEIVRFGFYGYPTFSGRRQATVTGSPAIQPTPTVDSYGATVCGWSTTATWTIPSNATPGIYVYNMIRTDNTSFLAQGIFVVRSTKPASQVAGSVMLITSDTTWHAYNVWGAGTDGGSTVASFSGRSLYTAAPADTGIGTRAFAVSYDRPFSTVSTNPTTYFWDSEVGLVNFLEGNGYAVDYYTCIDLEKDPTIPSKYSTVILSGHSEYWTANMRDAIENARDNSATNVICLASNVSLWHTRFDPADTNKREMICYKDSHNTTGYDNTTKYDPVVFTGTWRDARTTVGGVNNTNRRPETSLTGLWFIGNGTFEDFIGIPNANRSLPLWRNSNYANSVSISFGGSSSATLSVAGTGITVNQPSSTAIGDLMIIAFTFNGSPGSFHYNGVRPLRRIDDTGQTTIVGMFHAIAAGAGGLAFTWDNSVMANALILNYKNAIFNDSAYSMRADTGGTTNHTTDSVTTASNDRWAVCLFADSDTTGSQKTTSWTAGAGLTLRGQVDNSSTSGPWNSIAGFDTNSTVTQAAHSYSATAQFGNPHASATILYITPGHITNFRTVGFEWEYLKEEEPTSPTNVVRLTDQLYSLERQAADYNGDSYAENAFIRYSMVMWKAASGALTFNAGTWRYQYGISFWYRNALNTSASVNIDMQQVLINVLGDFGVMPTTLLSTTANGLASQALVAPGTPSTAADYGLTITDPGYQTIFGTTVPATVDNPLGSDATVGTLFSASAGGHIYGIRWYFPETKPNQDIIGILYSWTNDSAGTELARATFVNAQTGWSTVLFNSPISITANTKYVAAVWTFDRDVLTTGLLSSSVTNGSLTASADTTGAHNGKFISGNGSPAFPTSSGAGNAYFADVLYVGNGTVNFEGWGYPIS